VKKLVLVGAVAALAVAVAGCGGGGSTTLSKEEYSAKLNQICTDLNAKNKEIGQPNSIPELADKGPQLLDEFDKAIAEVKKLKAPDELKDAVDKFISLGEEQRSLISDLIDAAKKNDTTKINELGAKIDPLDTESNDIAKNQLNAPACAEG
jgi:outer membrane murein-binding lipoprotein Lpp